MDPRTGLDISPRSRIANGDRAPVDQAPERARTIHSNPVLSFVIPAFNEEPFLARAIGAIHDLVPPLPYEVIVVDNGSTDATPRIASELGADLIHQPDGTIGALRNRGVASARGAIVVFLDADVILTPEWAQRIPAAIDLLSEEPSTLTGSRCYIPPDASWLERFWFAPRDRSSHIGSGHMVLSRQFFLELGGFDESLVTGEDYDLSRRAVAHGGRMISDGNLRAEHLGFPSTISAFIQRESWHGVGDYSSLSTFLNSKVALSAAAFGLLHVAILVSLLMGLVWIAAAAVLAVISLCLLSSYRKYSSRPVRLILFNAGLYWLYYLGRLLALFRRIAGMSSRGSR
jgi:glycosyltransferase involved in cell wall biosynthesis